MKRKARKNLFAGTAYAAAFVIWTVLVQTVDVRAAGMDGTNIGFAALNSWFHKLTGVHMGLYFITDWMGMVPVLVCLLMGAVGLVQLLKRKSLFKVDPDIILLGIFYIAVAACYLIFEMFPVNYRPVLIEGVLEASYPSSSTLLVLSVMPTLAFYAKHRLKNTAAKHVVRIFVGVFSAAVVFGRLLSGVHWVTDIAGAAMLSAALLHFYKAAVYAAFERN